MKPEDGDGDKFDAVLRQLAVVVFYFEFVAEEAREAVNHDNIEGGRLSGGGLYHPLILRAAVFGGAVARLHECFDELVTRAYRNRLRPGASGRGPTRYGRPDGRQDAQIEGGAQRDVGIVDGGLWIFISGLLPPCAALRARSAAALVLIGRGWTLGACLRAGSASW